MTEFEFLTGMPLLLQAMEEPEVIFQELKMNITVDPEEVVRQLKGYHQLREAQIEALI